MTTNTIEDEPAPASPRGGCGQRGNWGPGRRWRAAQGFAQGGFGQGGFGPNGEAMHYGPPLPVKVLGVLVAFAIFKPLGVAALAFLGWQAWQRHLHGDPAAFGPFGGQSAMAGVQNSAFRAHARDTMTQLQTEARELAAHERAQREARDLAELEAFRAAQAEKAKEGKASEGKTDPSA